jgi:hypothetical protein
LIDDSRLTVDSTNLETKRAALIDYLWGAQGLPSALPTVERDVASPIPKLRNLRRVDLLHVDMDGGESNRTLHFVADRPNGRLVVVAFGHFCEPADADEGDPTSDSGYGQPRTIGALLEDGYSVLVTYMPHMSPSQCGDVSHNDLVERKVANGHAMKWFVEPIAVSLNYLKTKSSEDDFPTYADYSMIGLSGGGWTTTIYAAIDPTIRTSIPVAGSVPIHLRSGSSRGDAEQTLPELYAIAGYPDLYVLGAAGAGRRQVQVLNRRDGCCFGESAKQYDAKAHGEWDVAMRAVERDVQKVLRSTGKAGGSFRLEIDEAANNHTISWNTVIAVILAELGGGVRAVGATSGATALVRVGGRLWQWDASGWTDTTLPTAGSPAVVESDAHGTELFYRSPSDVLMHAVRRGDGDGWNEESLSARLSSDPIAIRASDGAIAVAAVGDDYHPRMWVLRDGSSRTYVATDARVAGTPALVAGPTLELYVRGLDGQLHLFEPLIGNHAALGERALSLPTAVRATDGVSRVYVSDAVTGSLQELSRPVSLDEPWPTRVLLAPVESTTGNPARLMATPWSSLEGDMVRVHGTTRSGSLAVFTLSDEEWLASLLPSKVHGSPISVGNDVFGTSTAGRLWRYDGERVTKLGWPNTAD